MIKKGVCKHFNGVQHGACKAGVGYGTVRVSAIPHENYQLPCFHPALACEHKELPTEAEIEAVADDFRAHFQKMMKGISPCCNAPLDASQVIPSGRYEGRGPRFCSECTKLVYRV